MKEFILLIVISLLTSIGGNSQNLSTPDRLWLDSARIELKQITDMKNETIRELGGESFQQQPEGEPTDYDRLTPEEKERHDRELAKLRKKAAKKQARENSKGFFRGAWKVIKAWFGV